MYKFGTRWLIFAPIWATQMILETSKIYSIFGTISGDPKGASHCSLETYLVPSSVHFTWKFECAIFRGSWDIKGGVKLTKMEKIQVTVILISQKSWSKLSPLQGSTCEKISPNFYENLHYVHLKLRVCRNCDIAQMAMTTMTTTTRFYNF